MGRADRADALHGRVVVEQHPAAAIDLRIDIARHQPAAAEVDDLRIVPGVEVGDDAILDPERAAVLRAMIGQDAPAAKDETAHRVSVTLRRCGGWSGFSPRRNDTVLTMR
ncbi:hypothetical protein ACVOMT_04140 [Sphingomonas panni]